MRVIARPMLDARVPLRAQRRLVGAFTALFPRPRSTTSRRERLGGVPSLWVSTTGAAPATRVIMHLHGGAYVLGSPASCRALCGRLARVARAAVVIPDYRLAPENPYPAAEDDALATFMALLERGHEPGDVIVSGDSAGAGLAVALALRLRDSGLPLPAGLVLLCPWLDLSRRPPDSKREPALTSAWLTRCARRYVGDADPTRPGLAPTDANLVGLPPMVVQSAADDPLAGDARRLVRAAVAAAVPVEHREFAGLWHDFHVHCGMLADADAALADLAEQLDVLWAGCVSALRVSPAQ